MIYYELLDHTADLGIRVTADDIYELFEGGAHTMFDQIVDRSVLSGAAKESLTVSGIDKPDLLIGWLRELLYLWNGRERLVKWVHIEQMDDTHIAASIWHDPFDPAKHEILSDIKAVTYHGVTVEQTPKGWVATVIFDV
ncbi:MAG TPA: archease [Desulfosalsimonadaceae bacterium]|nr:archease [Desulfosalsimonadaceae bacterium]